MGRQPRRKRQVLKSDEDVQPPPRHTQRAGAGAGGVLSQLRKVPNAKAQNVVVPPEEPENAMAPSPAKKKGTRRTKAPRQNTVMGTPTPVTTGLPVLHIMDNGRFGLQDQPIPLGYVGSKPLLQSHQALPEPDSMTPVVQSDISACTRGAGHGASRSARGVARGAVHGVARVAVLAPDMARVSDVQHHVGARAVSHSPQVSNQHSKPSVMTPHAAADIASSASCLFVDDGSDGADGEIDEDGMGVDEGVDEDEDGMGVGEDGMGLDEDDTGFEEEDGIGIEEDDIGLKENGDTDMDYVDYGNEDIMYASDHIANPGAEDKDKDNTAAAHMDGNQQNRVQHRPGQAEKRTNCTRNVDKDRHQHSTTKAARSNAPAIPDTDYDLLQHHHVKNRNSPDDQHKDSEDDIDTGRKCRIAKKKGDVANPTTLSFFPHLWGKLLDYAKANFRLYLAISDPFPDKEDALSSVCSEAITEAIVHWQDQKRQVEKGFYPKYKREMAIVVYNDAATFRSRIKQVALAVVPLEYGLALLQGNTIASIKTKASGLLKKASFLHGDRDAEGRTSNFANNALRTICHKVYYDSGSKSLRQFPTFQKTIPPNALILVTTIVRNVLEIYSKRGQATGARQTAIPDSEVAYESILTLYKRVNKHLYHGPKLHQMLQSWAAEGLNTHGAVLGNEGHNSSDWDVDLD
ncbi:hypothetical protein DFH29DRAFT_1005677 [Suillus ampliporus]|nr:hypothetical protein DFH29DRAFT_1005677 [Suillus ampliporus]